ncbi:DUF6636 domain-containing protein [Nocardia sp. NPDC051756]|uniref:DUF6636 domain-containing protein n=1 Tax=Nocardia sp. NPDC051756 TaxID=3154751 RepID=UPI00343F7B5E
MKAIVLAFAAVAAIGALTACSDNAKSPAASNSPGTSVPVSAGTGSVGSPQGNSTAAPETAGADATTKLPSRDDATVDARDYQSGDKYYFQSPSGNILCGFVEADSLGTGCQLAHASVVPAELPDCGTRANRAVAAQIVGGKAKFLCTSQGIFVGPPLDGGNKGGGKVLGYGQTLIVRGTACTSTQAGIRCDQGGHGFFIAADAQSLF